MQCCHLLDLCLLGEQECLYVAAQQGYQGPGSHRKCTHLPRDVRMEAEMGRSLELSTQLASPT